VIWGQSRRGRCRYVLVGRGGPPPAGGIVLCIQIISLLKMGAHFFWLVGCPQGDDRMILVACHSTLSFRRCFCCSALRLLVSFTLLYCMRLYALGVADNTPFAYTSRY
jgi:hypothetical protein